MSLLLFPASALLSAGHDGPLLYPGPLCGAEGRTTGPAGVIDRDADHFSSGQESCRKKTGCPSRTCRARSPARAKRSGLSLWLAFSLATQRESNSAFEGGRKLLLHNNKSSRSIAHRVHYYKSHQARARRSRFGKNTVINPINGRYAHSR
jgi:hypothetical protein